MLSKKFSGKKIKKVEWLVTVTIRFFVASLLFYSTGTTGQFTDRAAIESIEFKPQLLLVESPLPTFFCFISCSVFVSDSSPPSNAYTAIGVEESNPVNAAAVKAATSTNDLFIANLLTDYLYI